MLSLSPLVTLHNPYRNELNAVVQSYMFIKLRDFANYIQALLHYLYYDNITFSTSTVTTSIVIDYISHRALFK